MKNLEVVKQELQVVGSAVKDFVLNVMRADSRAGRGRRRRKEEMVTPSEPAYAEISTLEYCIEDAQTVQYKNENQDNGRNKIWDNRDDKQNKILDNRSDNQNEIWDNRGEDQENQDSNKELVLGQSDAIALYERIITNLKSEVLYLRKLTNTKGAVHAEEINKLKEDLKVRNQCIIFFS